MLRAVLAQPRVYSLFARLIGATRGRLRYVHRHIRPRPGDKILDIGCGPADAFYDVSRDLVTGLHPAEHHYGTGCHDANYWRRAAPAQLAFVGRT